MKFWARFLFFVLIQSAYGAEPPPLELRIDRPAFIDKLTQQTVSQTFQDSRGALWIVTEEGLSKYTGHELENYLHIPSDPNSLPAHIVTRITEDSEGNLWISTLGGGIARFNAVSNSFEPITADPNSTNTPYSNDVHTIFSDLQGTVWLGYTNGFSSFDPKSKLFKHYISGDNRLPFMGKVKDFTQSENGTIWAATERGGLLELAAKNPQPRFHIHRPGDASSIVEGSLFHLTSDRQGHIWIASETSGVSRFDPSTKLSVNFKHNPTNNNSISSNTTRDIFEDFEGNIWVATVSGLDLYSPSSSNFFHFSSHNIELPDDSIYSIHQSREGIYWIGTRTTLVLARKAQFHKFNSVQGNLSSDSVNAFAESADGSLWVGTDDGLNRLLPDTSEFSWINEASAPSISSPVVMSLFADNEALWVGTYDGGLNRLDLKAESVEVFRHSPLDEFSIAANGITSILRASSGQLIIGTYGGGLSVLNEETRRFQNHASYPNDPETISDNRVLAIYEDSQGYIWIGTENGLNRFDISEGVFQRFMVDSKNPRTLSSNILWSFHEDQDGNLWIGTEGGGLNFWPAEQKSVLKGEFVHFLEEISLPSASVYGIEEDRDGWLWLSHNQGLTRIEPRTLEAHHYGIQDGLQSSEFNLGASFTSRKGTIFFGGIAGFNSILPQNINLERKPPKVAISRIRVMDEQRNFGAPYYALKAIDLSYEDRMLSVEFYAADYTSPDQIKYAYKLDGINPDWVISPDSRVASFTTLPPGQYTLNLAAASPDGTWNWDGLSIPVIVAPPPWRSPYAYALYAALAAALVAYYFHRQRRKAALAQETKRELEKRVEERTRDLEEARKEAEQATKAKSDFLATMSHEIRTPMHGIIGMTELLLHTNLSSQQQQFANAAHKSGESLLELINEILDFSKVEATKVELEQVEFSLTKLIEDICYLQGEPAARKGLSLNQICNPEIPPLLMGDPTKLRQVIMNLVGNSIKFTHKGNINVRVDAKFPRSQEGKAIVHICVEDDGIGMDENTQQRVFEPFTQADTSTTRQYGGTGLGLSISRHYIDLMGGDINVKSIPNKGTRITVSIPLPVSESSTEPLPEFEEMTALVVTENPSTYAMAASILNRANIETTSITSALFAESSDKTADLLLFDYDGGDLSDETVNYLDTVNAGLKIVCIPLSTVLKENEFQGWLQLTKPIMSADVHHILASQGHLAEAQQVSSNPISNLGASLEHRILVAEDVPTNQRIVQEMLQLLGYEVDIAENGKAAVELFSSHSYSLIFMDCQMPVMDGYEATRAIRAIEECNSSGRTPIVALTAGSDEKDREICREAGMDGYITKPFTLSDIESHLADRLGLKREADRRHLQLKDAEDESSNAAIFFGDPDTINLSAIDSIRDVERQTGSPLLPTIFTGYREQMVVKLKELHLNIAKNDPEEIYKTAHAIKSMSANIGAEKVRAISALMEQNGRDSENSEVSKNFADLKAAYEDFLRTFEAFLTEHSE